MACGRYPDHPIKYWLDWDFVDGAVCVFGDQIGVSVTMLLFFGVTFLTLSQATDSFLVPVAVLIALGPLAVVLIPAIGWQFSMAMLFLGLASTGFYIFQAA